jgi:phosphoserine aminotransferase
MSIPKNYRVLFMQGGASLQFSAVPLNLAKQHFRAGYFNTGYWSQKAMAEAKTYVDVVELANSAASGFKSFPQMLQPIDEQMDYIHCTPNETIGGVELYDWPDTFSIPLVADMSSTILSRPFDVSRFGVIYAGAQKNIGPAGLAIVIVREDLLAGSEVDADIPKLLNYQALANANSMLNTPPTFAIYLANLVFDWLIEQGGVSAIEKMNLLKASILYDAIEESTLVNNDIEPGLRSRMNVPFFFHDTDLQNDYLKQAEENGLLNLNGHRSAGGCRASIYNAMPLEGVEALVQNLKEFEKNHV